MRHVLIALTSLALIVAPTAAAAQPRPVIAWTHGTWGIASRCAPSLSAICWTVTAGPEAVKRGDVVVAPDYSGIGDRFAAKPAPSDCGRG